MAAVVMRDRVRQTKGLLFHWDLWVDLQHEFFACARVRKPSIFHGSGDDCTDVQLGRHWSHEVLRIVKLFREHLDLKSLGAVEFAGFNLKPRLVTSCDSCGL